MKVFKIILNITFIISLLLNSAGQGYALRPIASKNLARPLKASPAGKLIEQNLKDNDNEDSDIDKTVTMLTGDKPVFWEAGCGEAEAAWHIANRNPDINVIAADLYDKDGPYQKVALKWYNRRELLAHRIPLPNLVVIRVGKDIFDYLPDDSIRDILILNPEEAFFVSWFLRQRQFSAVWDPLGTIYVKPFSKDDVDAKKDVQAIQSYGEECDILFEPQGNDLVKGVDVNIHSGLKDKAPLLKGKKITWLAEAEAVAVESAPHTAGEEPAAEDNGRMGKEIKLFKGKPTVIETNITLTYLGWDYDEEDLSAPIRALLNFNAPEWQIHHDKLFDYLNECREAEDTIWFYQGGEPITLIVQEGQGLVIGSRGKKALNIQVTILKVDSESAQIRIEYPPSVLENEAPKASPAGNNGPIEVDDAIVYRFRLLALEKLLTRLSRHITLEEIEEILGLCVADISKTQKHKRILKIVSSYGIGRPHLSLVIQVAEKVIEEAKGVVPPIDSRIAIQLTPHVFLIGKKLQKAYDVGIYIVTYKSRGDKIDDDVIREAMENCKVIHGRALEDGYDGDMLKSIYSFLLRIARLMDSEHYQWIEDNKPDILKQLRIILSAGNILINGEYCAGEEDDDILRFFLCHEKFHIKLLNYYEKQSGPARGKMDRVMKNFLAGQSEFLKYVVSDLPEYKWLFDEKVSLFKRFNEAVGQVLFPSFGYETVIENRRLIDFRYKLTAEGELAMFKGNEKHSERTALVNKAVRKLLDELPFLRQLRKEALAETNQLIRMIRKMQNSTKTTQKNPKFSSMAGAEIPLTPESITDAHALHHEINTAA